MNKRRILTKEMLQIIGTESETNKFKVYKENIIRFAESIQDYNPLFNNELEARKSIYGGIIAPPTFLRSCYPGPWKKSIQLPFYTSVDGGSDWEYFEPIRDGDVINVTAKITDLYEKSGHKEQMLLQKTTIKYINQFKSLVAKEENIGIFLEKHMHNEDKYPFSNIKTKTTNRFQNSKNKIITYEDIYIGMELPTIIKTPNSQQLVKYAAASLEFPEIHYDIDYAKDAGLPGVLVQGSLKHAFLGQLITDWMGQNNILKKLSVSYRGMDIANETLYCKGLITEKYIEKNHKLVKADIWIENDKKIKKTFGEAIVQIN